jgi:hypothetical protein
MNQWQFGANALSEAASPDRPTTRLFEDGRDFGFAKGGLREG